MRTCGISLGFFLLIFAASSEAQGVDQSAEIAAMHRWAEAKFGGHAQAADPETSLLVSLKPGAFARKNIQGHAFLISDSTFADGIAMRSPGEVQIEAPAGITQFEAMLGVDSNDVGYYSNAGRGSVIASVSAAGRELYRSPILHEGLAGIRVSIDLHGEKRLTLRLEAVGERPPTYQAEWDQADWADARITLANDQRQSLSSLPLGPLPGGNSSAPPFSFELGGESSNRLLPQWRAEREQHRLDRERTQYSFTYTDLSTMLSVRAVAVVYDDFPVSEWTLYFKNGSKSRSAVLEKIRPLDVSVERGSEQVVMHHSKGSMSLATDFQPLTSIIAASGAAHLSSIGGRPTDGDMPYLNLAWPNRGVIAALGWPGQWDLDVTRERAESVRIAGGQSATHFRLEPGEEVRTPLAVVQFWSGDWIDGQNVWRSWMVRHNVPRPGGKLPPPQIAAGSGHFTVEMQEANEENQKKFLLEMLAQGLPLNYWWMDAGWYRYRKTWVDVGTWQFDQHRFPHGFKPITDLGHERGVKSVVWFEPERVTTGSELAEDHPEWLIGPDGRDKLLDLGNKDAWHWLLERVSKFIRQQGVDTYRQDFNFEPLPRWKSNDTVDRQGISEIRHVEGYLAFFDELRRRFPDLLIDTCASGGRRLDLETLRRAVPLWRSDYPFGSAPMQMQTYGLALWVPYFGTSAGASDPYTFRSEMTPAIGIGPNPKLRGDLLERQLKLLSQWREVAAYYYDAFVPLTAYSGDDSAWMAWQWARADGSSGIVQVFRREKSAFVSASFPLRELKPDATYRIEDFDSDRKVEISGEKLMKSGLLVLIEQSPGAAILKYSLSAGSKR